MATLLDEHGHELPVVSVPRVSVDVAGAAVLTGLMDAEHEILNPFMLGCDHEVKVCVFAAFLVAKFQ